MIKFNSKNIKKLGKKGVLKRLSSALLAGSIMVTFAGCNRTLFDAKYGLDKVLIYGDDTAIIMDIDEWKDYKGEQLQLKTDDNMVILSSSFDTNLFYGNSNEYSPQQIAANGLSESGEVYALNDDSKNNPLFNKKLIDTNWKYNKSITFNGNNAIILPIRQWKDYSGEQFQVITKDGLVLNLCSTNTKLIYDEKSERKAIDFASMYVGSDGNVIDFSTANSAKFNYDLIDTKYGFNKAIILKDGTVTIFPIDKWCDYEGEQLQLTITNGPTIVTAAYDTILVNDIESELKANDIAEALAGDGYVNDFSTGIKYDKQILFNRTIADLEYGFSNAIISNDNSATTLPINHWNDYEGEQLQIELKNGDVILTSSMMLDLLHGGTKEINVSSIARSYVDEDGKIIDNSNESQEKDLFNKTIIDTKCAYNYAIKMVNGNVTIIPINEWKDFYNSDGDKSQESSSNCEQLQLVLPDGSVIVTTAYDTALIKSDNIEEISEYFRGENGVISDLTPYVGESKPHTIWNKTLLDLRYRFNYAIMTNGNTAQSFPIEKWLDFSDGEQLQLKFNDKTGVLTSFVNTSLIYTNNPGLIDTLSNAFSGTLDNENSLGHYK